MTKFQSPEVSEALRACREHFWLLAILSALINLLYLTPSIYMLQVYDRVVPTGGLVTLLWITLVTGLALLTLGLLDAIRMKLLVKVSLRVEKLLARPILDRLLAKRKAENGNAATSQILRDFDLLRGAIGGAPALALIDLPWTPIYVIVAAIIHPLLALLIIVGGSVLAGITYVNQRMTRAALESATQATKRAYTAGERLVASGEIVRTLGMRQAVVARQMQERAKGTLLGFESQMTSSQMVALGKFSRLFLQSLALGLGAWLAVDRQISIGAIVAVSILLTRALQPIEQLLSMLPTLSNAQQAYKSICDLFESSPTHDTLRTAIPRPQGYLTLEDVHVRSEANGEWLLQGMNLTLLPGRVTGIVGASGSGKTTLARVMCGGIVPDKGAVRIDKARLADWDAELLGRHIGYLPQEIGLLPGTIAENISRFDVMSNIDRTTMDRKIMDAAQKAGIHDMIMALPGGYERRLALDGVGLSTGQRQRIALARALYGDPSILILDEPNSAVDGDGEMALIRALDATRKRGATIIVIAHRANLLSFADDIVVLGNGKVQDVGASKQILQRLTAGRKPQVANLMSGD